MYFHQETLVVSLLLWTAVFFTDCLLKQLKYIESNDFLFKNL